MSQYPAQVASAFSASPLIVQGVLAVANVGAQQFVGAIAGEPDRLESAAPRYTELGSQIGRLAERAVQSTDIEGWEGQARSAFNAKVADVAGEMTKLGEHIGETSTLLTEAAQAAREAAEKIVSIVKEAIRLISDAYRNIKAAAAVSLGAAISAFVTWVVSQASRIINLVRQVVQLASDILDRVGQLLERLGQIVDTARGVISQLVDTLTNPETYKPVIDVLNEAKDGISDFAGTVSDFIDDYLVDDPNTEERDGLLSRGDGSIGHDDLERNYGLEDDDNREAARDADHRDDGGRSWGGERGNERESGEGEDEGGLNVDAQATLIDGSAETSVASGEVSGETEWGPVPLEGSAGYDALYAGAEGQIYMDRKGIGAEGSVEAGLVQAEASGQVGNEHANANASAEGYVGAEASGSVNLGKTDHGYGLGAEVEGFAGAKAEGSVGGEVAGVGGEVTGEAWAGIGAEADVNVGFEDGKFTVGASAGAALGVGGKVGGSITIDVNQTVDTVRDTVGAVGSFLGF